MYKKILKLIPLEFHKTNKYVQLGLGLVGVLALYNLILLLVIFINHLYSPDINRGSMFEAMYRVANGLVLYPTPTLEYTAIAYNPMFSLLSAVLSKLFGISTFTLRLTAILGTIGSCLLIFQIVKKETSNVGYGLIAAGLFSGAYFVFDAYYDYANPDSWLLLAVLLGLYLINTTNTDKFSPRYYLGVLFLCLSFWFKQQGIIMLGAGLLYITFRVGFRRSIVYWLIAGLLVPFLLLFIGPKIFGSHFLFYTLEVPSKWSDLTLWSIGRYAKHLVLHWPLLTIFSVFYFLVKAYRQEVVSNVWLFFLPFAIFIGVLGVTDPGSENNVFLLPDVWLILVGLKAISEYVQGSLNGSVSRYRILNYVLGYAHAQRVGLSMFFLLISLLVNLFPVQKAIIPNSVKADYEDFINYVCNLDGAVYLPQVGQLPDGCRVQWTAHWVALEDMIRSSRGFSSKDPRIVALFQDLVVPSSRVYIITDWPLEDDPVLQFLTEDYTLLDDWGERYRSLRGMEGRYGGFVWPRYVYIYNSDQ